MIGEQAQTLNRGVPERRLAKEVLGKHLQKGGEESNHPNSANNLIDAAPLLSSFEWRAAN